MQLFWIGPFSFINMSRPPSLSMKRLEREVRPGVNDVTVWNLGAGANQFQILTVADTETGNDARAALRNYELFVGDVLQLWWAGIQDTNVLVHHVEPLQDGVHATLLGIGGRLGTSRGMIRAAWTLEYWPVGPQQQ